VERSSSVQAFVDRQVGVIHPLFVSNGGQVVELAEGHRRPKITEGDALIEGGQTDMSNEAIDLGERVQKNSRRKEQ